MINSVESVIQVFCGTAVAGEPVTVSVFDKEVGVGDIVAELGNFVESRVCAAFCGEPIGLLAAFDVNNDDF